MGQSLSNQFNCKFYWESKSILMQWFAGRDFLQFDQDFIYFRYSVFRLKNFFRWKSFLRYHIYMYLFKNIWLIDWYLMPTSNALSVYHPQNYEYHSLPWRGILDTNFREIYVIKCYSDMQKAGDLLLISFLNQ